MSYFPETFSHTINKIKIELDLANYAAKSDFKKATGAGASDFAKNADLHNLKPNV